MVRQDKWVFAEDQIKETWLQVGERFDIEKVDDKPYTHQTDNIDLLQPRTCPNTRCIASPWYPRHFMYCPTCGSELVPAANPSGPAWASPCGALDTSRFFAELEWVYSGAPSAQHLDLPGGGEGQFSFVITKDGHLIAIDRSHARIFSYSFTKAEWVHHGTLPATRLPPWAWAAAPGVGGVAIPTEEGPCWVEIPMPGKAREIVRLEEKETFRATGGTAFWEGTNQQATVLMPVASNQNLFLAWHNCSREAPWEKVRIDVTNLCFRDILFGVPALNGGKDVFWSSDRGFIAVRMEHDEPKTIFYDWPDAQEGCPQFTPYRDMHGMLWQLIYDTRQNTYLFTQLSFGGILDSRQVNGPHLCVGTRSFMTNKQYDEPWQKEEALALLPERRGLVYPLLYLSNDLLYFEVKGMNRVRSFVENNGTYTCKLCIRKHGGGDEILKDGLVIRSPWDVEVFLVNNSLNLYISSQNKCWTWPGKYRWKGDVS